MSAPKLEAALSATCGLCGQDLAGEEVSRCARCRALQERAGLRDDQMPWLDAGINAGRLWLTRARCQRLGALLRVPVPDLTDRQVRSLVTLLRLWGRGRVIGVYRAA